MQPDISNLLTTLKNSTLSYDLEKITRAFEFARTLHDGQFRKSGEEYICHPIAVAEIVASLELDTDSICAAFLHDVIEDCPDKVDLDTVKREFGADVALLVDGLSKLVTLQLADKEERTIENLRKMFLAMSKDIRVIFIKLCDRLHNMRTLSSHTPEKQRLIALETMHVYAPLAHRLGMEKIKTELETLALPYLDPIGCEEVRNDTERKYGQNRDFLNKSQALIAEKLQEQNIKFSMEGRTKSLYSIYNKMYGQNKNFEEIYDFFAVRIIVDTELECYTVLGIIHENFSSMPGRFKDYISTPKPNMYRSLHTTVLGRDGIPFEVQIRTWEMHAIAEYGLAAHWRYKDGVQDKDGNMQKKLEWIRTLLETDRDETDPDEFLRPLKVDIFDDETYVFTPKGDVINLPSGACGIDFAYAIHSDVGNKMVGIKVNGRITPIDTPLTTGQIVEVLTSAASKGPGRDWLKIVKTSEARNKIRQWFKKQNREENIFFAKNELDRVINRHRKNLTEDVRNEVLQNIAKRQGFPVLDDFFNCVGYGGIALGNLEQKVRDEIDRVLASTSPAPAAPVFTEPTRIKRASSQEVLVEGLDNCQVKFARCCNPLPGDHIIGFVTKGFGISIHKYDCPNAAAGLNNPIDKDRWLNATWVKKTASSVHYDAQVNIFAHHSISLLADISTALADMRVPVTSIHSHSKPDELITITLSIATSGTEHFDMITTRLKRIHGVIQVTRGAISSQS